MTRPEAPRAASTITVNPPARIRGAGRWCIGPVPTGALLALPAGALFALPGGALATPAPAPDPAPPQTVNPPSQPPLAAPGQKAAPGQPVATSYPVLSADDELILEIHTQNRELTDTITAHGLRGGVYLPLGDLVRFLDLPINISDDGHYASGWFLSPLRTLSINLRTGTITLAGKETRLRKTDFAAYDGELWVKADRIPDLLPIAVAVDLRAQALTIRTLEPFPFQERAAREAARERLSGIGHGHDLSFPGQDTPYAWFEPPLTDVELRAVGNTGGGFDVATHLETDLRASGDFLKLTARAFVELSSTHGLVAGRLEMGRRDPDAKLLGPLHATEFELGDVATEAMPIGLRGVAGRGAVLTNEPLSRASVFDTQDFRGDLPSGYEVELYRNDALIGSTRTPVNGQYEFLKVPVDFGLNVFRLVFYGPQGQRREEIRRISVGDGRLAKGAFTYNLFAVQKDVSLAGITAPNYVPGIDFGAWRAGFSLQYGLTGGLTVVGGGALYTSGSTGRWMASAGVRAGIEGFAARMDLSAADHGGLAFVIGLGGKVLGTTLVATHADYAGGFVDEVRSPSSLPLTSMTQFDLSRTLHVGRHTIPLSLDWQHLSYANGQTSDTASFRQTLSVGRVMAANVINYTETSTPGTATTRATMGTFDLSTFAGSRTQYRAGVAYNLGHGPAISSVSGEIDHEFGPRTSIRAGVTRTFGPGAGATLALSATRKFGPVALSLDSTYQTPTRAFAFTVRLGLSFGRNPLNGRMFVSRPGLSSSGAVAIRAFSDDNGNGRMDPDEAAIGKVNFFTGAQQVTSNRHGIALLPGIGDGTRTAVRLDTATLPDISMAPVRDGIEIVPRAGHIPIVEFAIQHLSDIEGTAVYADGSGRRGVAGLVLHLLDRFGHRVARARSEGDGFLLIEQVRPGDYTLQIAPDQARTLKIRLVSDPQVHIGHKGKTLRLKIVVTRD